MNFTNIQTTLIIDRLQSSLEELLTINASDKDIYEKYSASLDSFKTFFENIKSPYFSPVYLEKGNPASSEEYNINLEKIYNDIKFLYTELESLKETKVGAYNFSSILTSEVTNRANAISSLVIDLNILSNFTRGDSIVAGDDFKDLSKVDINTTLASSPAELIFGKAGVGLARAGSQDISNLVKTIDVIPLSPVNYDKTINLSPTPGNFKRFYEGNFYNLLGEARPEGGAFNIQFVTREKPPGGDDGTGKFRLKKDKNAPESPELEGHLVDYGATKEEKRAARRKMIDQSPDTFWECEYLFETGQLDKKPTKGIGERDKDGNIIRVGGPVEDNTDSSDFIIDLDTAEQVAKEFDFVGRDLIVDIVVTFKEVQNLNFVAINPVLYGVRAFPFVEDISTADSDDSQFLTVDGWNSLRFPKTITPEANEFLTDSQIGVTLAPNKYTYAGQGIYPFPVRQAKRLKIRMRVNDPVPQIYERVSILFKRIIDLDITVTTTTKKGRLA